MSNVLTTVYIYAKGFWRHVSHRDMPKACKVRQSVRRMTRKQIETMIKKNVKF